MRLMICCVVAARRQPRIMSLEQRAYLDRLARLLLRHRRNRRAAACGDLDQALRGQRADRLAHGIAGHAEFVGEPSLDQPLAGFQSAGQDRLAQLGDDLVVQRRMLLAEPAL